MTLRLLDQPMVPAPRDIIRGPWGMAHRGPPVGHTPASASWQVTSIHVVCTTRSPPRRIRGSSSKGPTGPGDATGFFRPSRTELPPATPPPPPHGWVHATTASPPPPQPPQKRDSGAEGWGYSPMPRGHESTWPYTGRYTPAPPPRSRGAPVVPRAGSNPPPPPRERPPSGALAQPPRASRGSPPSQPGPPTPPPHQPQPQGPPGLPRAGPRPPGTRAPEPRCPAPPAPPVSLRRGPSRSGSAARGRRGAPPASTRIRPRG